MPKIKVNNINMYYETYGSGEPIVFICGFTADHLMWQNIVNNFAKQYQVIIFDNRGVGQSDSPNYPYTVDMMADDAVGLLQALNLNHANLVGNSLGGCIVQNIAYRYPKIAKSAVISNSFIKVWTRAMRLLKIRYELLKANTPAEIVIKNSLITLFSNDFLGKEDMIELFINKGLTNPFPMSLDAYVNQLNAVATFDSSSQLKNINCPSLIITSDEDLLIDTNDSTKMAEKIPNAEYFSFNKVGHVPSLEQPEAFSKLVLEFIGKQTNYN